MYDIYIMEGGYENTVIIDCNRRASEESKGDNGEVPSIFTNKTGVGVKLNPGDRVSIHSGFISKRGAGGETIELNGKETGKYITLDTLTKKNHQKQIYPGGYNGINVAIPNYAEVPSQYGCVEYEKTTTSYPIKDNEAHFNISYYKTTNGEGYFHLPRRFDAWKPMFHDDTVKGPTLQTRWAGLIGKYENAAVEWMTEGDTTVGGWVPRSRSHSVADGNIRCREDCFKNGLNTIFLKDMTTYSTLPVGENFYHYAYSNQYRRCLADIYFYPKVHIEVGSASDTTNPEPRNPDPSIPGGSGSNLKFPYYPPTCLSENTETSTVSALWKKKNDNSRYTIYAKEVSYFSNRSPREYFYPNIEKLETLEFGLSADSLLSSRDDYATRNKNYSTQIWLERRDPAQSEYLKYTETKKISLEPGEYTPGDIASELTNQLNVSNPPQTILGAVGIDSYPCSANGFVAGYPTNTGDPDSTKELLNSTQVPVSSYTESTTYKTFHTATSVSVEEKAFSDFVKDTHSLVEGQDEFHKSVMITATNYLSSYQFIGVKRPDLFEKGREIMKTLGFRNIGKNTNENTYNGSTAFDWATQKPITNEVINGIVPAGVEHGSGDTGWSWKSMINPYVASNSLTSDNRLTDSIPISWAWTTENLDSLKEYFDIQGSYPELYEGMVFSSVAEVDSDSNALTSSNSRFLHINRFDTAHVTDVYPGGDLGYVANGLDNNWKNSLGTDYMIDVAYPGGRSPVQQDYSHYPLEGTADPDALHVAFPGTSTIPATDRLSLQGTDALFFYFDESRKDKASGGTSDNDLYYGLFKREIHTNPYSGVQEYVIGICPAKVGGIPLELYEAAGRHEGNRYISYDYSRTIGIDTHFCGYGTSAIALYSGHLSQDVKQLDPDIEYTAATFVPNTDYPGHGRPVAENYPQGQKYADSKSIIATPGFPLATAYVNPFGFAEGLGTQSFTQFGTGTQLAQRPIHQYLQKRYVGAENPSLSFDIKQNRFNWVDLHTPERVGNVVNAGSKAEIPIVADTSDKVYFVNKRLLKKEFCPDMLPYADLTPSNVVDTTDKLGEPSNTTYSTFKNDNMTAWSIMDADCGIFLENFGFDNLFDVPSNSAPLTKYDWNKTLWNMLGFTYEQFYTSSANQQLSRQTRINNIVKVDTIGKPTTNANVEAADISQYVTNIFGAELRTTQIPSIIGNLSTEADEGSYQSTNASHRDLKLRASQLTYIPGATITQTSAQINAENLPIKQKSPYYLVKSDLISDTNYLGSDDSGQALNIMGVVPKGSGSGDFFFTGEGQQEFTITNQKTITSIRTQILSPDGSPAKIDDGTAVIYKIVKQNNSSLTVAEDMMNKSKKK